jgi:hypothetical protein
VVLLPRCWIAGRSGGVTEGERGTHGEVDVADGVFQSHYFAQSAHRSCLAVFVFGLLLFLGEAFAA